jgi:hypothetical protein
MTMIKDILWVSACSPGLIVDDGLPIWWAIFALGDGSFRVPSPDYQI